MKTGRSMQKYLAGYAEAESGRIDSFPLTYRHVLCIPVFAERVDFLGRVTASIQADNALLVLVLNAPLHAPTAMPEQLARTRASLNTLKASYRAKCQLAANISLLDGPGNTDILLVDRCSPDHLLDSNGGVGLARKIACDMACALINQGKISSPWIHTTDADASLPENYFQAMEGIDRHKTSAGIYPFRHTPNRNLRIQQAQSLYDSSLDYYVAGLAWAGSPWAWHTVGSTLVINSNHYAQARGFPKRQAGEDFYLLNKVAKTGDVIRLDTDPVMLESRLSDRIPFGTGPAMTKILALENPSEDFLFYHPMCFVYLRLWRMLAGSLWQTKALPKTSDIENLKLHEPCLAEVDPHILLECLEAIDLEKALDHALAHSTQERIFNRHMDNWFDAFLTLKFIHWLRDNYYPSQSFTVIRDAKDLPFVSALAGYVPTPPASNRQQQ